MVKSNVPQVAFTYQTQNHIFGKAINPYDRNRSTGGSTGGEAGLISSRCSPLGLGADMGGSIRIPASYCGIVGFKPGSQRLDPKGHTYFSDLIEGMPGVKISIGQMGKTVEDCALLMKALLN